MAKSRTIRVRLMRRFSEQTLRNHFHMTDHIDVIHLTATEDGKMTGTITFATDASWKKALKAHEANLPSIRKDVVVDERFREFRGFTILTQGTAVDIVAVHGMDGHAFNAWAHPSSDYMWLRDALPEQTACSNARILIYGYNANTSKDVGTGQIRSFAGDFLSELTTRRHSDPRRPLILVAHSLGGIVVKEALVQADADRDSTYEDILSSVRGVVFFGTPHLGGNGVSAGLVLANIRKILNLDARTDLIRVLRRNSDFLVKLTTNFCGIGIVVRKDIQIRTFFEGQKTRFGVWPFLCRIWIVPERSATLEIAGEKPTSIDRDHAMMCKFRNGDDASKFCAVIAELCAPREVNQRVEEHRPQDIRASSAPASVLMTAPVPNHASPAPNSAPASTFSGIHPGNRTNASQQHDRQAAAIDNRQNVQARDEDQPRLGYPESSRRPPPQPYPGTSYTFNAPMYGGVVGGQNHTIVQMNQPATR